jgi:hypothetical protein
MRVAWRSGSWEVTPITGSTSLAPHLTASSVPAKVPGAKTRRSGPHREGKGEGAGAGAPAQGPYGGVKVPEAPARRWLLHRGAGSQALEDGGGGEAERSSTTSAAAPAAGEETGGSTAGFPGAADSSTATVDAAASDATTTNGAKAANPTPAARSASGRGHPPKVRWAFGRKGGPPKCARQLGVV